MAKKSKTKIANSLVVTQLHRLAQRLVTGINIMGFTKEFNARTADQVGMIIPVVITVMKTNHSIVTKTPPALFFESCRC